MLRFCKVFLVACVLGQSAAYAMDGVFDREAEIQSYIPIVQTGARREFIQAARKIYMSGIGDERLARVLQERLQRDIRAVGETKHWGNKTFDAVVKEDAYLDESDGEYGVWLILAAGSTGSDIIAPTLNDAAQRVGGTRVHRLRAASEYAARRIEWHRRKNEIMASRLNHREGDNPQTSRLVNLLLSGDESYRSFVLDYIEVNDLHEPRFSEIINADVLAYIAEATTRNLPDKSNLIAQEIHLLGESNEKKYSATLQRVLESNVSSSVKGRAQIGLSKLR